MPQINPPSNQTTFPVTVGLLSAPPRLAFFCPSTGLHFDSRSFDAHYDWTGTGSVSLTFSPDSMLAPPGYSSLTTTVQLKPFSAVQPTLTQDGPTAIMTRPFPTSTTSSTASFNVWMTGKDPSGQFGVLAWVDPIWPVGKSSSGGPGQYAATQTDYYYMRATTQTILLFAQSDGTVNWLQTQYGAIVGQTAVISPPIGATVGQSYALTVSVNVGRDVATLPIAGTVGTSVDTTLTYVYNGSTQTLSIHVLPEAALLVTQG